MPNSSFQDQPAHVKSKGVATAAHPAPSHQDALAANSEALKYERMLRDEAETLNELARQLTAELDLQTLIQKVTDVGTELTGARYGAFFYNALDDRGESYVLFTLSGAPRADFERLGLPRNTPLFDPTYHGTGVVRCADVLADPRYGKASPHFGLPEGHVAVRSYLAAPVVSRSGQVLGGLFFGHPAVGVFTGRAERLVMGLAAQAAVAIDNASLYQAMRRTEEELRRRNRELQAVLDVLPVGVFIAHDRECSRITTNAAGAAMLRLPSPDANASKTAPSGDGLPFRVFRDGAEVPSHDLPMQRCARTGQLIQALECDVVFEDGAVTNLYEFVTPLLDAHGDIRGCVGAFVDITERRRAEEALHESEERLRLTTRTGKVGIWDWDIPNNRVTWTESLYKIHGVTAEQFPGTFEGFTALVHADDRASVAAAIERSLQTDAPCELEYRAVRPDGGTVWLFTNAVVVREQDRPVRMHGAAVDVTERHRVETALFESEQRLRVALEAGRMGAWEWVIATGKVTWSPGLEEIHGRTPGSFLGTLDDALCDIHPDDRERVVQVIQQAVASGGDYHNEYRIITPAGEMRWLEARGTLFRTPAGDPERVTGVCMDITKRKEAEVARRQSEQRFTQFMQHLPGLAWIKDRAGRYVYANSAALRAFRKTWPELAGRTDEEIFPPETAALFRKNDDAAIATGCGIETVETLAQEDGVHHSIVSKFPIPGDRGKSALIGGMAIDITERVNAERALRLSEQRYRQLLQCLPAAIYTSDAQGRVHLYNDAAVALWGREPAINEEWWCGSYRLFRPDGSSLPVHKSPMAVALREGRPVRGEEIIIERPDGSRRHILPYPEPLLDPSGLVTGAVNMLVDITDRKRAEAELAATRDHLAMEVAALKRLHELSAYLARSAEAGECLHAILHTIVELHQADCGIIALHDPRAESLNIGASTGIQHDVLAKLPLTPHAESGAIGSAFATRQRVVIEDVTTDARYTGSQSLAALAGVRAVHSTPILTRSGELLGVLTVYFRQPRLPTEREKQYADICALHAGDAIEAARAEQALRESEQRFRTMADTAPAMLWVTDANARCTFQSRAWYEYTGMDLGGASNFGWLDAVHPEDRDATRQEFLRANTQRASFSLDYRLRRADGAYRWVIDTGQPRFDADGAFLGYIGSVMDIHDRKQADQHLRMVLAELNHRVKNTLASIDAMAHQTARHSDSLEQFQQSFSQRIRSLGHAHGLLTRTRWEGASLRELLKTELKPRCGHDEQVHLNGPAIILRPKAALALHMVIHELATNAAKYGALSAAQGHVEVEWYVAQQSDEAQLHLRWTELGGPPVAPPVRRGFGSRVLDATVAYELEGELKLEFRKTGLICVINFPLTDNSGFLSTHDEEREKQVHLPIE